VVGSAAKTSSDPRATFAALAQVTTVTGQGPVYSFTMAGAAASALVSGPSTGSVTGTVTLANNTISDLAFRSPVASGTAVHFTYSDIGSAPPIVAPQVPA
jgi:hypothetical protein